MKNVINNNWEWVKLGQAVEVLDNLRQPINSNEREKRIGGKRFEELFPYYGATGQVGWIDDFKTEGEFVLIGEDGAPFLDTYKKKAYKIQGKTWVNNHAHILQEVKGITTNNFILHYLNSINYHKYVNGTTRLKLTKSSLIDIPFPVPPIKIQIQIVSKIEELFSELDKSIEELKTAQHQLKVYRQAVLKWAFEGRLTDIILNEGELPKGWKRVKLKEIASKITDGEHATPQRTNQGILLLSARNIHNGELKLSNVDYVGQEEYERIVKRCNPETNDILISCSGSVGRVCRVPKDLKFVLVRSVALVKMDWNKYSSKYFEYLFQSPFLQKQIEKGKKATAQANLFLGPINHLEVLTCSLEDQQSIVQEIESRLSVCDKIEETINGSLRRAEALRQSILKSTFEGNLL